MILIFVLIFLLFSKLIILFKSKLFFFWVSTEIMSYSFMVLLIKDSMKFSGGSLNKSVAYFMIQSVGSLFMIFSLVASFKNLLFVMGLLIKTGLFPFFWWLPFYCNSMNFMSFFVYLGILKFSSLYMFTFMNLELFIYPILIMKMFMGLGGMYKSLFNFKLLLSWGSLIDGVLLLLMSGYSMNYYFLSYLFYLLFYSLMILVNFSYSSVWLFNNSFLILLILSLSGIPLLFGFVYKVFFFLSCLLNFSFKFSSFSFIYLAAILIFMILQSLFFLLYLCKFYFNNLFSYSYSYFNLTQMFAFFFIVLLFI